MPQGKAVDLQERELVIRLKEHFDRERYQGSSVSTGSSGSGGEGA
jgi:hypothetical protein